MTEIDGLMEIKGKLKMKNIIILFLLLTGFVYSQSTTHFLLLLAENRGVTSIDTIPSQFTFTDLTDVALNSSNEAYIVVAGCDSARFYPASGDSLKLGDAGTYDVDAIWAGVGDTVYTPLVASGTNLTATHSIIYSSDGTLLDTFSVTTLADVIAPSEPTDFIATVTLLDTAKITLTWTDPVDADLDYILIYMSLTDFEPDVLVDSVAAGVETYTTEALTIGAMFWFRINSRDSLFNKSDFTRTRYEVAPSGKYWYVDVDATGGAHDGTSWANAEQTMNDVFADALASGDIIWVSDGTYGRTRPTTEGVDGGIVTVRPAIEVGHTGTVLMTAQDSTDDYVIRPRTACQNLRFTGLTVSWATTASATQGKLFNPDASDSIWIDNCHIISNGNGSGILAPACDELFILDNIIETSVNSSTRDQDCIGIYGGTGGHTIMWNTLVNRGTNATPHKDCLQIFADEGGSLNKITTIANNFMYAVDEGIVESQCLIVYGANANRFNVYNNIFIRNTAITGNAVNFDLMTADTAFNMSVRFYNNTVIEGGSRSFPLSVTNCDTLIVKNNIFMKDSNYTNSGLMIFGDLAFYQGYKDFDYNHYFQRGDPVRMDTTANGIVAESVTFDVWQSLGYDVNGDTGTVTFDTLWGTTALAYKLADGSAGINTGVDLSTIFTGDFLGAIRPKGILWDKGAFERAP